MTTRLLVMTASLIAAASATHAQPVQALRVPTQAEFEAELRRVEALATDVNVYYDAQPATTPRSPQPPAAPQPPVAPRTPVPAPAAPAALLPVVRRGGQPINIRVDLTITDQRGGVAPVKKTVTVVTGDGWSGSLRSTAIFVGVSQEVPLNVDAEPSIQADGKIRLSFNLQYDLPSPPPSAGQDPVASMRLTRTNIRESMTVILESGKAITVAQSADPIGDRQVTVEVMATVLK
jgi:hypothetical protein